MRIRLLAVDLDGTLLNGSWQVTEGNFQAVAAAAARGVSLVLVTGRRLHSARHFVDQFSCPVTLIASNGALIMAPSGQIVYRDFLPRETAREVLQAARDFRPYAVAIFDKPGKGQLLLQDNAVPDGPLGWYLRTSPDSVEQVQALEPAITSDPVQVMFGGPPARIEPVEDLLRASPVGGFVKLTWTKYFTRQISILDVMNQGCSKGRALKLWSDRLGIDRDEVMAVGDNFNDLEMLEFAGQPVLMGNCSPELAHDGWPMTLSNDQDGVAAAIHKYIFR